MSGKSLRHCMQPRGVARHASCVSEKWWREVDSNHRRRKPADLQSAPVGRLGIPPGNLQLSCRLLHQAACSCHPASGAAHHREVDDSGLPALRPSGRAACASRSNSLPANLSNHRRRKPADLQSAPLAAWVSLREIVPCKTLQFPFPSATLEAARPAAQRGVLQRTGIFVCPASTVNTQLARRCNFGRRPRYRTSRDGYRRRQENRAAATSASSACRAQDAGRAVRRAHRMHPPGSGSCVDEHTVSARLSCMAPHVVRHNIFLMFFARLLKP